MGHLWNRCRGEREGQGQEEGSCYFLQMEGLEGLGSLSRLLPELLEMFSFLMWVVARWVSTYIKITDLYP